MRRVNGLCGVTGVMLLLFGSAAADDDHSFRLERKILTDVPTQDEIVAVTLDSDVYGATRNNFPDLRVLDAADRSVPFLIQREQEVLTRTIRKAWTVPHPSLQSPEENGLEIRFTLEPEDPQPLGLRFVTPLKDFEQRVRVFGIDNGKEESLTEDALIFDYSQYMDVRRTEIPLPETSAREFRIVLDKLTAEQESELMEFTRTFRNNAEESLTEKATRQRRPFRIDRIELWTELAEELYTRDLTKPWPVRGLKVKQDADNKRTVAEFETNGEPVTSLTIVTSSRNFARHVLVQTDDGSAQGTQRDWSTISEGTISQFQLRGLQEENLQISISENRSRRMRILVENVDSPEITIDGVEASGVSYQVVFLADPEHTYRLTYDSPVAQLPSHDVTALRTALANKLTPLAASLGPPTAITNPVTPVSFELKQLLNNPLLLGTIVGLLVLALGWGLYQASKRIEQVPHGDSE